MQGKDLFANPLLNKLKFIYIHFSCIYLYMYIVEEIDIWYVM